MRALIQSLKRLAASIVFLGLLWALGLLWFWAAEMRPGNDGGDQATADAIVVLTGDAGRLAAGYEALAAGRGTRLLISGVNVRSTPADIKRILGADDALFTCCIDMGRRALDTRGNAIETAAWAQGHGFASLIIVTADYHMPRSLIEFRHQMPGMAFIARPVRSTGSLGLVAREYSKFLVARAWAGLFELQAPDSPVTPAGKAPFS